MLLHNVADPQDGGLWKKLQPFLDELTGLGFREYTVILESLENVIKDFLISLEQ